MKQEEIILSTIKSLVKEEISDAKVYLFGSRATGKVHDESDWDILVITSMKVSRDIKNKLRDKLFFVKALDFAYIDLKIVNEKEWYQSPTHYVLRHSIKDEVVEL